MTPLETAARALCKAQSDCYDDLPPEAQADARETVRAVLASLWQPIDTAPLTEDAPILVYCGGEPHPLPWIGDHHVAWLGWRDSDGKPVWFNGDVAVEPTLWMPLIDTSLIETQERQDGSRLSP